MGVLPVPVAGGRSQNPEHSVDETAVILCLALAAGEKGFQDFPYPVVARCAGAMATVALPNPGRRFRYSTTNESASDIPRSSPHIVMISSISLLSPVGGSCSSRHNSIASVMDSKREDWAPPTM